MFSLDGYKFTTKKNSAPHPFGRNLRRGEREKGRKGEREKGRKGEREKVEFLQPSPFLFFSSSPLLI